MENNLFDLKIRGQNQKIGKGPFFDLSVQMGKGKLPGRIYGSSLYGAFQRNSGF